MPSSTRSRTARWASWLGANAVEVVFVVLVASAFAYSLRITRQAYFFADEWRVIKQAGSIGGMLDEYNNSLSLVTMVLDRGLVTLFGFAYTPFRVVGLACLYGVPLAYFFTTRARFGAALAALLAFPLLWYGRYVSLLPGEHNHHLAVVGGVIAAAALNRGRRADGFLLAGVALSLCSAGGGVAVAAACLVHCACTRAPIRRWLAVLAPTVAWLIWWLVAVGHTTDLGPWAMNTTQTIKFIRGLAFTSFLSAGLGIEWLGYVLLVAFIAVGVRALTRGLVAGANFLGWTSAIVVWGLGLANSRGIFANTTVFRYRYGALVFALLAIVPRRPIRWPGWFPIATDRRYLVAAAGAILVLGVARGVSVRGDLRAAATQLATSGRTTRSGVLILGLGPSIVPDQAVTSTGIGAPLGRLRAGEVRELLSQYGNPLPTDPARVDQQLVDLGFTWQRSAARHEVCTPLTGPFAIAYRPPAGFDPVMLSAAGTPFSVETRRFGGKWIHVTDVRADQTIRISLPSTAGFGGSVPWQVRAHGACRSGAAGR